MARSIKYSTTQPTKRGLRRGDLVVSTGDEGYGPTSATGYFNGISPPSGGYTVYSLNASGDPVIWVAANDSELEKVAFTLGGVVVDGPGARAYLSALANTWIIDSTPYNIVTDDLILDYNFKNLTSYPGSGEDVNDLSGGNRDGTLLNDPNFNEHGYFVFDGVDDSITTSNTSGVDFSDQQTICFLLKPGVGSNTQRRNIWNQAYGGSGTWTHEKNGVISYYFGTNGGNSQPYVGRGSGFSIGSGEIAHIVSTRNQTTNEVLWYKNGVLVTTSNAGGYAATANATTTARIALGYTGQRFIGDIYDVKIYNRALTAEEVSQNYYMAPIVTGGLVLLLDAGNVMSYERGDTTAHSLIGSPDGYLINGAGYSRDNGGTWVFDGVNDCIKINDVMVTNPTSLTIGGWFRRNGDGATYEAMLHHGENSGVGPSRFWIGLQTTSNKIVGTIGAINVGWSAGLTQVVANVGEWNHVVSTWDGSTVKTYVNGEFEVSYSLSSYSSLTTPTRIGASSDNGTYAMNASITHVFISSNEAYSPEEVKQNYNANKNRFA